LFGLYDFYKKIKQNIPGTTLSGLGEQHGDNHLIGGVTASPIDFL
jgi:hypothetical protein